MNTFFEQIARHYETLSSNEQLVIDFVMRDHNIDRLKIKTIYGCTFCLKCNRDACRTKVRIQQLFSTEILGRDDARRTGSPTTF